jgi:hypothetical protein
MVWKSEEQKALKNFKNKNKINNYFTSSIVGIDFDKSL